MWLNDIVKYTFSEGGFYCRELNMAKTKPENRQSEFRYSAICHPVIWCHFIRATARAEKPQLISSLKYLWSSDIYLTIIMHSNFQKLSTLFFPFQQFHNLLQLLLEVRTLHTVGANKCAWIRSLSFKCEFGGYDCGTLTITNDLRSYMATGFQTYKLINNWCNWEHIPVV